MSLPHSMKSKGAFMYLLLLPHMELMNAIDLIRPAANRFVKKDLWADLGCGAGLFTRALAAFLYENSIVYAVDKDRKTLADLETPERIQLQKLVADFSSDELSLSGLDGILMANSLHFVRDKSAFIDQCNKWLRNNGCFLLIEYDSDTPNPWVPYPLSFVSATKFFQQSGFQNIKQLGQQPSKYNRAGIYSALIER